MIIRWRPEMLHQYTCPARDPNGGVAMASMLDMQAWDVRNKVRRRAGSRRRACSI
jgi:hypothetical protein